MTDQIIVVYSDDGLESERLISLVTSLGYPLLVYRLGVDFSQKHFVQEFGEEAEFPQANCGYKYVGSLKQILAYFNSRGMLRHRAATN